MTDRKLANEIIVTATPDNKYSLTIDGQEFPWYIDTDGVNVQLGQDDIPGVTIRIIANHVRTDHAITPLIGND